jgi:hypothetical protein
MSGTSPQSPKERADNFYLLIGHCIANWAQADEQLFYICRECIGPYEQSAIIYYRTPGMDIRLNLVDELVKSVLPKRKRKSGGHDHPLVKQWNDIVAGIKNLLSVRRRIAHQPVQTTANLLLLFANPSAFNENAFRISPSDHEKLREKESDVSPIVIDDLREHLLAVDEFTQRLRGFREKLIAQTSASPAQDSPPAL